MYWLKPRRWTRDYFREWRELANKDISDLIILFAYIFHTILYILHKRWVQTSLKIYSPDPPLGGFLHLIGKGRCIKNHNRG